MFRKACFALLLIPWSLIAGPAESSVKVSYLCFKEDEKKVTKIEARFGSGTVVEFKDGYSYVLTCRHVCPDDDGYLTVIAGTTCIQAHFVAADGTADLALIRCKSKLEAVGVADRPPDAGTTTNQYGYPGAGPKESRSGTIVGNEEPDGFGYTPNRVNIAVRPGDSGSGVFVDGKLVGVIYAGRKGKGENEWVSPASSVKLSDVQRFLKEPTKNPPKVEKKAAPKTDCPPGKP